MHKFKYLLFLIPLFFIPFLLPKEAKAEIQTGWVYIQPKSNIATRIGFDTTGKLKLLLATGSSGKSSGQKFLITKLSDGTYRINTGAGGGFKVLTNSLEQEAWNKSSAQKFNIIENSDSTVQIVNGNKALTYSNKTIGTELTMSAKTTNDNQKFIIKPFAEKYTVTFTDGVKEENLLKNTNNKFANTLNNSWHSEGGWNIITGGTGIGSITTITDSKVVGINTGFKITGNADTGRDWAQRALPLEKGETYEVSAYVRNLSSGTVTSVVRFWDNVQKKMIQSKSYSITGKTWQKISYQFIFNGSEDVSCQFGIIGAGDIEYHGMSLKKIKNDTLKRESVQNKGNATAPAIPTRTGYTFAGWDKIYTEIIANTNITAKWTINKYKVIFNGNGATSGSLTALTDKTYNTSIALPTNTFIKAGHTFNSWNTKADGSGRSFKDKSNFVIPGANTTLYAQWKGKTGWEGEYYYVNGVLQKGLQKINNKWYLFDKKTGKYTGENGNNIFLGNFFVDNATIKGQMYVTLDGKNLHKINTGTYYGRDMSFIYKNNKFYGCRTKGGGTNYGFYVTETEDLKTFIVNKATTINLDLMDFEKLWAPEWMVDYQGNTTGDYIYYCAQDKTDIYKYDANGNPVYRWKIYRSKTNFLPDNFAKPELCTFDDYSKKTTIGINSEEAKTIGAEVRKASPEILDPAVTKINGQYIMSVKWLGNGAESEHIDIYTSNNGTIWTFKSTVPCFNGNGIKNDIPTYSNKNIYLTGGATNDTTKFYATDGYEAPMVAYVNGVYYCYVDHYVWTKIDGNEAYEDDYTQTNGLSLDGKCYYATSTDLKNWTYQGTLKAIDDNGNNCPLRHGSINIIKDKTAENIIQKAYNK